MDKKKGTSKAPPVSGFLARFRGLLQACAVLLTNPHLPNLFKGQIYRGKGKTFCVPGLNCYSCPAATGACPIGAIQSVIGSSKFKFSYYVTGTLILLGVLLGKQLGESTLRTCFGVLILLLAARELWLGSGAIRRDGWRLKAPPEPGQNE